MLDMISMKYVTYRGFFLFPIKHEFLYIILFDGHPRAHFYTRLRFKRR